MSKIFVTRRTPEEITRERNHFDKHVRYLLHFLELDGNAFNQWLIRQVLKTWDRQIAFLQPEWIKDRDILDVGCGHPRMLFYFKQMGARQTIGIDLSRQFVDRGLRRGHSYVHGDRVDQHPEQIRLIYGDVNDSVLDDVRVDTITCFQSLHHLDLDRFVDTCRRVLRPGGRIVISDPVGNHPLRRLGDRVGRISGLLSQDERSLPPELVERRFRDRGFQTMLHRSLNPSLEIAFQMSELLLSSFPRLALYSKIPMALLRPLENFLEATLLTRFPRWGWRYFLVFRLADGDDGQLSPTPAELG